MLDRRTFLRSSALGLTAPALGLTGCSASSATPESPFGTEPFRISLAQWSLHRRLRGSQKPPLDNLDFAAAARGFGIDAVEYVNQFFKERARDTDYLRAMRERADGEGVRSLLIMVDGEGNLGDPDEARRSQAVERHRPWLEAAQFLGCHSIRVNARSEGTPDEQRKLAADGLRRLCEHGASHGLNVLVENHGGLSSNGAWLSSVMRMVDHPRCGTLPDFGNFNLGNGETYDRYRGVEELMPFARAVSAKSHDFDDAGDEIHTDYRRMLQIVLAAGYDGYVGIEYEGRSLSEDEGVQKTASLLREVRREIIAQRG